MAKYLESGERVKVAYEGTISSDGPFGTTVRGDDGEVRVVPGCSLTRIFPEQPPRGSLIKVGGIKYLRGWGAWSRINDDGSFGGFVLKWADIYKPGYQVATFK